MAMNRRGFALLEVIITAGILAILLPTLGMVTIQMMDFAVWNRDRADAIQIARNDAERLRALGPDAAPAIEGTETVDVAGSPDPEGRFTRTISSDILCLGGEEVAGLEVTISPNPCDGDRYPIFAYVVEVEFSVRGKAFDVGYEVRVAERGRFAEALPATSNDP